MLLKDLTLEQKAKLTVGGGKWTTSAIPEHGIGALLLCDGPNGVRKENNAAGKGDKFNEFDSFPATCMPTSAALASSWDRNTCLAAGKELGKQARAFGVNILLGPGVNHKRTPIGGRNFEYFSEDPFLTGRLAGCYVDGVQSQGVGCALKHFYANNTEFNRTEVDVRMDERARREIYLAAFEYIVRHHKPLTVMAAYNKTEGSYCTENSRNLIAILREEWGFDGLVMSDWWAIHDTVNRLRAGCNLEMPYVSERSWHMIVEAVENGELSEARLDEMAEGVLRLAARFAPPSGEVLHTAPDLIEGHASAVRLAKNCVVLLKNQGALPLKDDFCFIGLQAKNPSIQGAGSSRVNTRYISDCLKETERLAGKEIPYCCGYAYTERSEELLNEACAMAEKHNSAVIFLGYATDVECESEDRSDMNLLPWQNELVDRVASINKNTVVVLQTGAPVAMPWIGKVNAVVQAGLLGEGSGEAVCSVLSGTCNPSGRLAETYPVRLEDNPSYRSFAKHRDYLDYEEGILTGYRYYATENVAPLFPFGYGLSYTHFTYGDFSLRREGDKIIAETNIANDGGMDGEEVVQLYVSKPLSDVLRPARELKGFEKVFIPKGDSARVSVTLDVSDLRYYNTKEEAWCVESGEYIFAFARDALTPIAELRLTIK